MSDSGRSLARLLAQLPEDPVRRGREFERLCKWLLENDPVYRARLKKVWHWDRWPGRWGRDAGIDLVAEAHDGSLWAIQAKAYGPEYPIKKEDVDTFLSESARPQFGYRLIVATTDRIGSNARRVLDGQQIPVGTLLRGDLLAAAVAWPPSFSDLRPSRPRPKKARPHQRRAVRDVVKGLEEYDRGQLVMACGTGKTLTSLFVAEALEAKRVLFLVPSLSLLSQVVTEWTSSSTAPLNYIAVCSDQSVVGEDELVSTTSDLSFPVTVDPQVIAEHLQARSAGRTVVFSTYQSSERVAEAMRRANVPAFDIAFADEAHRLVGRPERAFATILREGEIRARKRLFMTATPRRFTQRVVDVARQQDLEVASMADTRVFGPRLHTLKFGEAISQGLLTDYRVAVIGVDDRVFLDWADRGVLVQSGDLQDIDARSLATHIGLAKAVRKFDIRRAISFHGRVKGARWFARDHVAVLRWMPAKERPEGTFQADFISGEMSAGERRVKLESLRAPSADRALLANARCLTEGIDVPALDGVAFVDPKSSDIDIVQAVGRAIRLSESKDIGTIVVPVFVGTKDDPEALLAGSVFRPVWEVLNALRSHDDDLADKLDGIRQSLGRRPGGRVSLPSKIQLDLPKWVNADFSRAIRAQIVERTTSSWEFAYGLLTAFSEREGHGRVPVEHLEAGFPLGTWAGTQRTRREGLDQDRRLRLEKIPGWTWDPYADAWDQAYSLLCAFSAREGHALVPQGHLEQGFRLGQWVSNQRSKTLDSDRRRRLEQVPGWVWDANLGGWDHAYSLVREFAVREGHARVPRGHAESGFLLGDWAARQRGERGKMPSNRRRLLEELPGWSWDPRADDWEKGYLSLRAFVAREGHAGVPAGHEEDGFRLGGWVVTQRSQRTALGGERRRRLDDLPGWSWHAKNDAWERNFSLLQRFAQREGHVRVPAGHKEEGVLLESWVKVQRNRRDSMSIERRQRLEQVAGWTWDPFAEAWESAFALLCAFVEREGHALVPQRHREAGFSLGAWVNGQRAKRKTMDPDRRRRLEEVPGWAWQVEVASWERGYDLLLAFAAREGHARVPKSHLEGEFRLGSWVNDQRTKGKTMDLDRRRRLEEVAGWVWNSYQDAWEQAYSLLITYAAREGSARVPAAHIEEGFKLGRWVNGQRRRREALDADLRHRLEEVPGWTWDSRDQSWERAYSLLLAYATREGNALVPARHLEGEFRLGSWVNDQRTRRRTMNPDRRSKLEEVAGWVWDVNEDGWEQGYSLLKAFAEREGHARVPQRHKEGDFRLGSWVGSQRSRRAAMDADRRRRLEGVSGWSWDPFSEDWERAFAHLRAFATREGHARVPMKHVEAGFSLGQWVGVQRARRKTMTPSRRQRLEAVGGWAWDASSERGRKRKGVE